MSGTPGSVTVRAPSSTTAVPEATADASGPASGPDSPLALAAPAPPAARLARGGGRWGWWCVCAAGLALICVLSLMVGSRTISPAESLGALFQGRGEGADSQVIWDLRVPRTLLGLLVGAALGVGGALIQALTRNPLADPGILGVNAGAAFAVVIGTFVVGVTTISGSIWWALAGAGITTAAVYLLSLSGRGRAADPSTLVLGGMALGAVLQGISTGLSLVFPHVFSGMRVWSAGHLSDRPLSMIAPIVPFIAVGLLIAFACAGHLNAVALGDDAAKALGVRVGLLRVAVIVSVTLLCGAATALAGPVGFVGLMVPHVVRWCFGVDQRWILAFTVILAPVLLLGADLLGRVILWPNEVAAGIVTGFIGAPVLIFLARRRNASTL